MKNFVAVDTSGNFLTVLACKNGACFSTHISDCSMRHSTSLLPAVEETLRKADMTLKECDFFSAAVGAGSFTGIRIGISAVKGFCLASGKPSLPVTSFDVAAYTVVGDTSKRLALIDALHGYYYACGYEGEQVVYPPAYLSESEVLSLQAAGYRLLSAGALSLPNVETVDPVAGFYNAIRLKERQNAFGELTALYVRKSSAELNAKV